MVAAHRPVRRVPALPALPPVPVPAEHRPGRRLVALLALLPGLTLLAACTDDADSTAPPAAEAASAEPSPFADCAALTAAPPSAAPASDFSAAAGLPEVVLPCFTGGRTVRLADVRGPAVINMWASWCEPCRAELPIMQRLADRAGGRLHVLGVDTNDGRDAAASFGAAKRVTMPTLYDRERRLLGSIGRINLPVTIFVDAAGRDYVHPLPVTSARELSDLVRRHTGVTVTP
jgi:cytochrome c biogenesis protein CcmG/thiol:disulfide interchange protein DsbE